MALWGASSKQHVTRGAISKYAVPQTILFVESLDTTSVGKLDKKALRQKYGTLPSTIGHS
jgi:fatty-acyl-CoA synthase